MKKLFVIICVISSTHLSAGGHALAFSGSTRAGSFNQTLVVEAVSLAREAGMDVKVIDLKNYEIPFYNADLEAKEGMPLKAKQFRRLMVESDVILVASPEYNGSLSAILKNAIDWASRSEDGAPSREAFKGKKFVIMSTSPGAGGGARGLAHLRAIIENIGGTVVSQQIVIPNAYTAFDQKGLLKDLNQKAELQQAIQEAKG